VLLLYALWYEGERDGGGSGGGEGHLLGDALQLQLLAFADLRNQDRLCLWITWGSPSLSLYSSALAGRTLSDRPPEILDALRELGPGVADVAVHAVVEDDLEVLARDVQRPAVVARDVQAEHDRAVLAVVAAAAVLRRA
jgi:hypothetical protein